jgi:ferredoxin-NADP reductase
LIAIIPIKLILAGKAGRREGIFTDDLACRTCLISNFDCLPTSRLFSFHPMLSLNSPYKILQVQSIKEELPAFKTFSFRDGHGIQYEPGQYLTLVRLIGDEEVRRSYSITSSPYLDEPLTIGVKRMDNGLFSRWLVDTLQAGDEVQTTGAGGFFIVPADFDEYKQVFFFAAGSGITPIYSLVKTILHRFPGLHVVLVYSNASPGKTIFFRELQLLSNEFRSQFHIEFLFSNDPDLKRARLNRDLLLELVSRYAITSFENMLFYSCGPESYMRLCTYVLQEHGVPKENIRKENFVTHKSSVPVYPPDQRDHKAFIHFADKEFIVDVHYPDSILKAAKKQHISLPFSCEAGQCGNCVAICRKGQVWHSNNEVLTDRDLQKGLVLTCVGHPVGGDVYLEIS